MNSMSTLADPMQQAPPSLGGRFRRFHLTKQLSIACGLLRGAIWRLRGRASGWPVVHHTVRVACRNGRIRVGHFCKLSRHVHLEAVAAPGEPVAELSIGAGTRIWDQTRIVAHRSVSIGDQCAISWNCSILDSDHHRISFDGHTWETHTAPITIEDHVWIGCNVTVLKGVTIGRGSVVAAGSVVTRDIPPHTLAAGVPAKPLKHVHSWQ